MVRQSRLHRRDRAHQVVLGVVVAVERGRRRLDLEQADVLVRARRGVEHQLEGWLAQPLEEEFVIPSRPARLRRRMASASPSLCIVVTITLALLLFWKAIFAS